MTRNPYQQYELTAVILSCSIDVLSRSTRRLSKDVEEVSILAESMIYEITCDGVAAGLTGMLL